MKYYSETRFFIKRTLSSIPMEDIEARAEAAYRLATEEIYADCKPLKIKSLILGILLKEAEVENWSIQ